MEKIIWPISNKHLAELLGVTVSTIRSHRRNYDKHLILGIDYTKKDLGVRNAPDLMYAWTIDGAIKMAHYCKRSSKAKNFLKQNNIDPLYTNYIEGDLIEIIYRCFNGIYKCRKQHYFRGYAIRVDLFIEDLKLVVECDERGHSYKDIFSEEMRDYSIENDLKCYIVKFNPNEKEFNIGDVIHKILLHEKIT